MVINIKRCRLSELSKRLKSESFVQRVQRFFSDMPEKCVWFYPPLINLFYDFNSYNLFTIDEWKNWKQSHISIWTEIDVITTDTGATRMYAAIGGVYECCEHFWFVLKEICSWKYSMTYLDR